MNEYRVMQIIAFYYKYLLLVTLVSAYFFWFNMNAASIMLVIIILAVPFLLQSLLFPDKTLKKKREKGKMPVCPLGHLIVVGVIISPVFILPEAKPNSLFCLILYLLDMGIFFFYQYYKGKYNLLYCNPSVTDHTRERAEGKLNRMFFKLFMAAVFAIIVLFFIVNAVSGADIRISPPRQEQEEQQEEEPKKEADRIPAELSKKQKDLLRQKQKEDNFFLLLLRYAVFLLLVLLTLFVLLFLLYRIIMYFVRKRRKISCGYYEEIVEENDQEEYTRLVPAVKREPSFPGGNNGKIRKAFYRAVRRGAGGKKVDKSHTPYELRDAYLAPTESSGYLTALYEKAKYSPWDVTDDEIKKWEEKEKSS